MLHPVVNINSCQFLIFQNQYVLRILLLCRFGEIETAGNHGFFINDHDLVMGYGVFCIDISGHSHMSGKVTGAVFC